VFQSHSTRVCHYHARFNPQPEGAVTLLNLELGLMLVATFLTGMLTVFGVGIARGC
jgi:hypothetical protein